MDNNEIESMIALLCVIFINQLGILVFLYFADRTLKLLSKSGFKPVVIYTLQIYKRFFVYYKRKDGHITRFAFLFMIIYYIINITGFTAIFIQLILKSSLYLTQTSSILVFLHIALLIFASSQCNRSFEEKKILDRYMDGERVKPIEKRAVGRTGQIITALINKDSGALTSLFSKKAQDDAADFSAGIDTLLDFIQGGIESWERGFAPFEVSRKYFNKRILIHFTIEIKTDMDNYELFVVDYNTDKIDPDNEGIYMLEIRKSSYDINNIHLWRERICAGTRILED